MYCPRILRTTATFAGTLAVLLGTAANADAQRMVSADSLRQLQAVVPLSGPAGTAISVRSENLPLASRVHIAVGMIHAGFETIGEATQGEWGVISASVQIPSSARWDRPLYVIALNGVFSPIGISDPFHVTNEDGMVRRTGHITDEVESCMTFRDENDLLYALTGDVGSATTDDEITVEGTYSEESACTPRSSIAVARVVSRRPRGHR